MNSFYLYRWLLCCWHGCYKISTTADLFQALLLEVFHHLYFPMNSHTTPLFPLRPLVSVNVAMALCCMFRRVRVGNLDCNAHVYLHVEWEKKVTLDQVSHSFKTWLLL